MPNERLFVVAFMVQRHVPRSPSQVFVRLLRVFSEQYIEKVHSHQWTRTWAYFVLRSMRYWKIWTDFYWVKVKLTTGTKMRRQTHSNGYEVDIAQSLHKKKWKTRGKRSHSASFLSKYLSNTNDLLVHVPTDWYRRIHVCLSNIHFSSRVDNILLWNISGAEIICTPFMNRLERKRHLLLAQHACWSCCELLFDFSRLRIICDLYVFMEVQHTVI